MSPSESKKNRSRLIPIVLFAFLLLTVKSTLLLTPIHAGDPEYVGSLDGQLVPNTDDLDQIIFRPLPDPSKVKFATPLESNVNITAGRLYDPLRDKSAI